MHYSGHMQQQDAHRELLKAKVQKGIEKKKTREKIHSAYVKMNQAIPYSPNDYQI